MDDYLNLSFTEVAYQYLLFIKSYNQGFLYIYLEECEFQDSVLLGIG